MQPMPKPLLSSMQSVSCSSVAMPRPRVAFSRLPVQPDIEGWLIASSARFWPCPVQPSLSSSLEMSSLCQVLLGAEDQRRFWAARGQEDCASLSLTYFM